MASKQRVVEEITNTQTETDNDASTPTSSQVQLQSQKKTLLRWLNWKLDLLGGTEQITDLSYDLRNGVLLLKLLSSFTNTQISAETGKFRVQRLGNLSTVLDTMQRERARTVGIEPIHILDGNLEKTVQLVWSIILRWELQPRFQEEGWESFSIDQIISVWLSTSTNLVTNLTTDLQDGHVLCQLILSSSPNLPGLQDSLEKSAKERWKVLLRCCKTHLNTPSLLDSEDIIQGVVDKNSFILYLGILFSALPHTNLDPEKIGKVSLELDPELSTRISGSPIKTQTRMNEGRLSMTGWMNCLEEVLGWILEAEEHLLSLHNLGHRQLQTVKTKFYNHEDFMLELQTHQGAVGKVLSRGQELVSTVSNPQDQVEIRIQMKVLIERWEKVRELAMSKQSELHKLIMHLQLEQITALRTWMTKTEDRISLLGQSGKDLEEVRTQLREVDDLQGDLENQHTAVSAISNFILVESDEAINIEDELAGLGERWCMICRCIEERQEFLQGLAGVQEDQDRLHNYLQGVETMLKEMEHSQDLDNVQLQDQTRRILVVETELEVERERLTQLGLNTEDIQNRSDEMDPGVKSISSKMENLQDRWDVLIEILFAQKQRISKLGVEFSQEQDQNKEENPSSAKKRKVTGSKRIEFETGFERISSWSESILSRLQDSLLNSLQLQDQTLLLEDTEAEVQPQKPKVAEFVALGNLLKQDLESGPELRSIVSKVERVEKEYLQIQSALSNLKDRVNYQAEKDCFYGLAEQLNKILNNLKSFQVETETWDFLNLEDGLKTRVEEKNKVLESVGAKLEKLEAIGGSLTQHTVSEPENTVKRDLYQLWETFRSVESHFSSLLSKFNSPREDKGEPKPDETSVNQVEAICDTEELSTENLRVDTVKAEPEPEPEPEHYEECTVTTTLTLPQPTVQKSEIFITMKTLTRIDSSEPKPERELSDLERNLASCQEFLNQPVFLQDNSDMEDDVSRIISCLQLLSNAFVPASLTEEESSQVLDQLLEVKKNLRSRERNVKSMIESLNQLREEVSGLSLWMKEVHIFLEAEEAAFGDLETLEAQLKESNALQEDITTLQPNLGNIKEIGETLLKRTNPNSEFRAILKSEISEVSNTWSSTVRSAKAQNLKLKTAYEKSREVLELMNEINKFLDQLELELPREGVVTEAPELSQRTYKLLQLRDRTDRKSCVLDRLSSTVSELIESESEGSEKKVSELGAKLSEVQTRWSCITHPVTEQYTRMKEATSDYGEFKTLVAQESDWLDRLEKKLRRSSKCAADAEEISEELDDLENCLHNHPIDRIQRLKLLSSSLSEKDVLISPVQTETGRLEKRWQSLERQAKSRIKSLEECITEAQEWECKILGVQDWLTEKDILLTSHLEHELTVDDLPDETQKERMLREFEDKENILAEMDEQVDIYREEGKEEAAARLEDQLTLIHSKFQELSSKFELFQQPADYEGRLGRITRQLRDIQHNMYLTELVSHDSDSIQGQLHHTRCIYNALADIKPEVEGTIKMGRKLVETSSVDNPHQTSKHIDSLKELFNILGAQVTEAREVLQKALEISQVLMAKLKTINNWLSQAQKELENISLELIPDKIKEMKMMKMEVREVLSIKQEFVSLCADPSLLVGLKDTLSSLESKWSILKDGIKQRLPENERFGVAELDLSGEDDFRLTSPASTSMNSSAGEEGILLQEFRAAFQEISSWLETAEQILDGTKSKEESRQLGEQILNLQPRVDSLGVMADRILEKFTSQSQEVEPEMELLGQRWENVLARIDECSNFSVVEVEEIKTTIAQLVIPLPDTVNKTTTISEPEEISTLPEETNETRSWLDINDKIDSSRDSSPEFFSASLRTPEKNAKESQETIVESPKKGKTPPPTKPKPRWYVESVQEACSVISTCSVVTSISLPPVQHVTVTSSTLPSPRSLSSAGSTVIEPLRKTTPIPILSPMRTVLPSVDTSPSASPVISPIEAAAPQSILDDIDKQNERDNMIIDRLLRGTSADIEDVRARKSYSSPRFGRENISNNAKDIKEFEEKFTNISLKIANARQRLQELDKESDYNLRMDLIDMELQELEAEVATTISRGDTLVLRVHRFDQVQGDDLKERVAELRQSWSKLRGSAEEKKSHALRESEILAKLRGKLEIMHPWLISVLKEIRPKKTEDQRVSSARAEIDRKYHEMKSIERLASSFKSLDSLGGMKDTLISVRSNWGQLKDFATPMRKSKSKSPREIVDKSVPAELFSRITKLQEALEAIRSQLETSIMTGKKYENMNLQSDMLDKVRQALETLRPRVKKTILEIETVSGALSMEYFDRLTALAEKLREEWRGINEDFSIRENTWRECQAELRSFNTRTDSLSSWIAEKEKVLLLWKRGTLAVQPSEISSLQTEIKDEEKRVQSLAELGLKISKDSGATQAREIFNKHDKVRKRWRYIYTETSIKESEINGNSRSSVEQENTTNGNHNDIISWAEEALSEAGKPVNVSELEELKKGVHLLQSLQVTLINQRVCLDELAADIGENSTIYQHSRAQIEKLGVVLPKRLSFLSDKSDRLLKLVEGTEENLKWVENMQQKQDSADTSEDQSTPRITLSEREYSINKLLSEYQVLEKEVIASGFSVNSHMAGEVKQLKSKWLKLCGDVRRITPVSISTQVSSISTEIPKTSSSHSVSSFISLASLASPSSQSSEQWAASATTASNSPMSEDVTPICDLFSTFSEKAKLMLDWISNLSRDRGENGISVVDTDGVGRELDRFRALISQFESRKYSKEELIRSGIDLRTEQSRTICEELKSKWSTLQQDLMSRKTELTAMLEHADNLNTKGAEVSQWLGKLEKMLAGAGIGKTRDVLLRQIRDVNQIHRELQQYGHHVTLLSQVCQRLISIYTKDDTSGITRINKELTGRFSALTCSSTARGKSLQSALRSLNEFDQDLAEFLVWMGEVEGTLERMQEDKETQSRLEDVKTEVRERDAKFHLISTRGNEQLSYSEDNDIVLSSKVEELKRRWTELQNSILNLSDRIGKHNMKNIHEMTELRSWISAKMDELTNLKMGRNLAEIKRQREEHRSFREKKDLKEKELIKIRSKSISDMEKSLEDEWKSLSERSEQWGLDLEAAEAGARTVEQALYQAESKLKNLESCSGEWELPPSFDTADGEREEVESIISGLHNVEEMVLEAKIQSDSKPFLDVTERLSGVEQRLTTLKESAVSRREQLSGLVVQQDPGNQEFLRECVPDDWERCVTSDNIPYFSHHVKETTSWDHPDFVALLDTLSAMNTVKYCAYRLALKLRKVQQKLCLDLLDITSAVVCFDSHGLSLDKHDLTIAVPEMVTILTSIYETLFQCEPEDINVPLCVDLCLNWLLNVFDGQRTGLVRVLSFKLGLVILCRGPLNEKYGVMFNLATGGTDSKEALLDQRRLGLLLYDCMQIPKYLGEIALFGGSNIEPSVRSCLQKSTKKPQSHVNLAQFLDWLSEEPQSLVWIPVLHRLASAETATHEVQCKICRVDPIVGFRYHCRKCFNLDICHACFFLGKSIKGHKPEHPLREYCTSTNRTDNARHLLQSFRNSFRSRNYFKKKQKKLGYLPVQSVLEGENFESPAMSPNLSLESREFPGSHTESISSKLGPEISGSLESKAEEDEHSLIASYCRLLTSTNNNNVPSTATILREVDSQLDNLKEEAIQQLLEQLQEENSRLQAEHRELTAGQSGKEETLQEEKTLRQQKTRLEARMAILEDHNRQLEAQLDRLRQLVSTESCNGSAQTRFVVAAELHEGERKKDTDPGVCPPPASRRKPPTALNLSKVHEVGKRNTFRDSSGTSDQSNRNSGTSGSLNLSIHNTETQED